MKKKLEFNRQTFFYLIFIIAWTGCSLVASEFLCSFILYYILGANASKPFWTFLYYLICYTVTILVIVLVTPRLTKWISSKIKSSKNPDFTGEPITANDLGMGRRPNYVDIGLAPVGYVVYLIISTILTAIMSAFSWFNASEAQDVGFSHYLGGLDRIFAMLAIVFIAPIAEEIIMRGWLYGKLREKLTGAWGITISIIITSLLFSVLHGQWNVSVAVFGLSLVLCGLREITGTIWSGALLHILSNAIAFYLLFVIQMI